MKLLKKWWFWVLLIILLIAIWYIIGFVKCGGKSNPFTSVIGECKICPTDWVNCMPSPGSVNEYCSWVRENCPDAKIAV